MIMNDRLLKLLLALVLVATLLPVTPAFAVSNARAQALAYQKHSLGLTGVPNARDMGGYRTKDGRTISVTTFKLMANADIYEYSQEDLEEFEEMIKDPDHQYALLSEGNEFVLIQDFVFGKLLKPADYYSKDYKDEIPQIYYQELETVESR